MGGSVDERAEENLACTLAKIVQGGTSNLGLGASEYTIAQAEEEALREGMPFKTAIRIISGQTADNPYRRRMR